MINRPKPGLVSTMQYFHCYFLSVHYPHSNVHPHRRGPNVLVAHTDGLLVHGSGPSVCATSRVYALCAPSAGELSLSLSLSLAVQSRRLHPKRIPWLIKRQTPFVSPCSDRALNALSPCTLNPERRLFKSLTNKQVLAFIRTRNQTAVKCQIRSHHESVFNRGVISCHTLFESIKPQFALLLIQQPI